MRADVLDWWTVDLPRRRKARVELRRARRWGQHTKGWYDPGLRLIVVYTHPFWSQATVDLTLVHEIAHASGMPGCVSHGAGFRRLLARTAAAHLGVTLGPAVAVARRFRSVRALEDELWWRLVLVRLWAHAGRLVRRTLTPATALTIGSR